MKSYGLASLAPWPITHPLSPPDGTGGTRGLGRGMKAIATANLQIKVPEFHPKNLPQWAEEFSEFLLLTGQQHLTQRQDAHLSRSCAKGVFFSGK